MTRGVKTTTHDESPAQTAILMAELRISAMPVVDHYGRVLGVITDSRLRAALLADRQTIAEAVVVIDPLPDEDACLCAIAELVLRNDVAVVPVVYPETGQLAGVVTDRELLSIMVNERRSHTSQRDRDDSDRDVGRWERADDAHGGSQRPIVDVEAICAALEILGTERRRRRRQRPE